MEQNNEPEALDVANQLEKGFITLGKTARALRYEAAETIRRLHARVQELEKDRGNAKRLVSKIWNQHPEARDTIEKATGAWLVFGQDVETSGVSAQRVTQAADHIAQPRKMVAAQEPFGYFKAEPFGWRDCAETEEGAIALYEAPQPQAVGQAPVAWRYQTPTGWHATTDAAAANRVSAHHPIEPLYASPQPQADAQDAQRYRWLIDYFISDRVDLDDAIVAAKTSEDIAKIIDAAIAAAKEAQK